MVYYIRDLLNWYARLGPRAKGRVPYRHVAQLGDPALRLRAEPLDPAFIKTNDTIRNIEMLKHVIDRYGAIGLAAPQIGVRKRFFAIEIDQYKFKKFTERDIIEKEIVPFPMTVFINPQMKIVDHTKLIQEEVCESIKGFTGRVPRYKEVSITALNEDAKVFTVNLKGYLARVAQHEMDHLNGAVYTDIMEKDSFHCTCWKEVNEYGGKITLPFAP